MDIVNHFIYITGPDRYSSSSLSVKNLIRVYKFIIKFVSYTISYISRIFKVESYFGRSYYRKHYHEDYRHFLLYMILSI